MSNNSIQTRHTTAHTASQHKMSTLRRVKRYSNLLFQYTVPQRSSARTCGGWYCHIAGNIAHHHRQVNMVETEDCANISSNMQFLNHLDQKRHSFRNRLFSSTSSPRRALRRLLGRELDNTSQAIPGAPRQSCDKRGSHGRDGLSERTWGSAPATALRPSSVRLRGP